MNQSVFVKIQQFFEVFEFAVANTSGEKSWVIPKSGNETNINYLKFENSRGRDIYLRPIEPGHFLFIDDVNRNVADGQCSLPGRLVVESSPGNFQYWVHYDRPLTLEEKRYLVRLYGGDTGADPNGRWGRSPGFTNRKAKHQLPNGQFPFARLHCVTEGVDVLPVIPGPQWQILAPESSVLSFGCNSEHSLMASAQSQSRASLTSNRRTMSSANEIFRNDYETGDDSSTDIKFVMALLRRGLNSEDIRQRLEIERTDWSHHKSRSAYIKRTIGQAQKYLAA